MNRISKILITIFVVITFFSFMYLSKKAQHEKEKFAEEYENLESKIRSLGYDLNECENKISDMERKIRRIEDELDDCKYVCDRLEYY